MHNITTQQLMTWLDGQLRPELFQDYAPNGLQVQGKADISRIVFGVTASMALLEQAIAREADAIIVHHGWFWRGESPAITGAKYRRLEALIKHDINLIAYHLPLDAHPEWGNNAMLAQALGLRITCVDNKPQTAGPNDLIFFGRPPVDGMTVGELGRLLAQTLEREPLVIGEPEQPLERLAWCTGGAQGFFEEAIAAGAQAYITGEASEQVYHQAQESGVAYFEAGHHATERYGVQGLMRAMQQQFPSLSLEYIEINNPV